MKTLVIFAALLGSLLATDNINVNNEGNVGDNVHQIVNINNQDKVAHINSLNGWNSWDSIGEYGKGVFATRLYGKKMCVVTQMDRNVFPSMEALSTLSKQKPVKPTRFFKYDVNKVPIANIGIYGVHIEALCRGIPSYAADVNQVDENVEPCFPPHVIYNFGGVIFCI